MVVLERASAAAERGHSPRARLLAAARLPAIDADHLRRFLGHAGVPGERVGAARLVPGPAFDRDRGHEILRDAQVSAEVRVDADRTGQMFAAQAPLSLCLAADEIAGARPDPLPILVVASGEAGEGFAFLLGPTDRPLSG